MRPILYSKCIFVCILCLSSCSGTKEKNEQQFSQLLLDVKQQFAPHKHLALFEAKIYHSGGNLVLKGETNVPEAKATVVDSLRAANVTFVDSLELLPSPALGHKSQALINNSVANLRAEPRHDAELVNQALLGTPVNVLKKRRDWFLVQTPDGHIAWIDAAALVLMDKEEMAVWKGNAKIIFTGLFGVSYLNPFATERTETDMVMGCVLEKVGETESYFEVAYPDGRLAYLRKQDSEELDSWLGSTENNPEELVKTAYKFFGFPFLWGGSSAKGMDCNGFTKVVYYIHGMVIPRDINQQMASGKPVDTSEGFANLKPGDLLFFGSPDSGAGVSQVTHTAMWIGRNSFIHSSGKIRISSIDPESPLYDEYYHRKFLGAVRYMPENAELLASLSVKSLFMDGKKTKGAFEPTI